MTVYSSSLLKVGVRYSVNVAQSGFIWCFLRVRLRRGVLRQLLEKWRAPHRITSGRVTATWPSVLVMLTLSHLMKMVSARFLYLACSVRRGSPRPALTPGTSLKLRFPKGGISTKFWTCVKITTELIENFEICKCPSFSLNFCAWILTSVSGSCL